MRLLLVGGYGTFGGRIVELLEQHSKLVLIVAGRSLRSAEAYVARRANARAALVAAYFDRDGKTLASDLDALQPDIVIDASGPFQSYGDGAYRLIEACIAQRIHYLDLADGADFVRGVAAFDERARTAGVHVLSGVSSFPVLTAAVVRRLANGLNVSSVEGGIAPSPYAGVGGNVIRAIAGYAGQPVAHLGRTAKIVGRPFTQQRRRTIAAPGRMPLRSTMFSLVDVPDLRVLSAAFPEIRRVWMGAGPAPEVLHRALIACAWLVRFRILRSLTPLAPLMHWATNRLRWGEHRGGMYVAVRGSDADGNSTERSWHLLAEGDDGPLIPAMAVQIIVEQHLHGTPPRTGARACVSDVSLEEYERLFATRTIHTGIRMPTSPAAPVYQRVLSSAWANLSPAVRAMHDGVVRAEGVGNVERGHGVLAWLAGALMSFPPPMHDVPVSVAFDDNGDRERWTRRFGKFTFSSEQSEGKGRLSCLLRERFGALSFAMALVLEDDRLNLLIRSWSAFGVPLPLWLAPRSHAFEEERDGVFRFHVEISHPLAGLIVRYSGWLKPTAGRPDR